MEQTAWNCQQDIFCSRAYDLSAYDAAYLELAMREAVPLATLDERLKKAAYAVGAAVME
jgi:predicted nucleic acid-binding protein